MQGPAPVPCFVYNTPQKGVGHTSGESVLAWCEVGKVSPPQGLATEARGVAPGPVAFPRTGAGVGGVGRCKRVALMGWGQRRVPDGESGPQGCWGSQSAGWEYKVLLLSHCGPWRGKVGPASHPLRFFPKSSALTCGPSSAALFTQERKS